MANTTEFARLNRAITSIATSGKKLTLLIHETALGVMRHAEEHGDVSLAVRLYNALHKGLRVNSFKAWLFDHSPIRLRIDGDTGVAQEKGSGILAKDNKQYVPWRIDDAAKVTYWEYTREAEPVYFKAETVADMVENMRKRITRAIENDKLEPGFNAKVALAYLDKLDAISVPKMAAPVRGDTTKQERRKARRSPGSPAPRRPRSTPTTTNTTEAAA